MGIGSEASSYDHETKKDGKLNSTQTTKRQSKVADYHIPALKLDGAPHDCVQIEPAADRHFRAIFVSAVGLGTIASTFGLSGLIVGCLLGAVLGHVIEGIAEQRAKR